MTGLAEAARTLLGRCGPSEQMEVYGCHQVKTTVRAGTGGDLRGVARSETTGIGVRVIVQGREGYSSTSDLHDPGLRRCVEEARSNAALATPDTAQHLAIPTSAPDLPGLLDPTLAATTTDRKIELAASLARRATAFDPRVAIVEAATYSDDQSTVLVSSTTGVHAEYDRGFVEVSLDVVGDDGAHTASGSGDWCGRTPLVCDVDALAAAAVSSATRLLGQRGPLLSGVPLLLGPRVAAVALAAVGRAFCAPALLSNRGPFAGLLGERVAAETLTLVDDGLDLASPLAAPFDDEATPRQLTRLIAAGVATAPLHSVSTAHSLGQGQRSTGNARRGSHKSLPGVAPTALRLESTTMTTGIRAWPARAVYIDQIGAEGTGVSPVTGRVDVAAIGFTVRDGAPAEALDPFPFSTTLGDLLGGILEIGADARTVPGYPVVAPTLLLRTGFV